jgi:hypothetical protein
MEGDHFVTDDSRSVRFRRAKLRLHHASWVDDAAVRLDQSTRARLEAKLRELLGQPLVTQVDRLDSEFSAYCVDPIPVVVMVVAETGRPDTKVWMSAKERHACRLLNLLKTTNGILRQANEDFLRAGEFELAPLIVVGCKCSPVLAPVLRFLGANDNDLLTGGRQVTGGCNAHRPTTHDDKSVALG